MRFGVFTAGQIQVRSSASIQGGIRSGDYICGTSGAVEVGGRTGVNERNWIPSRLNGTEFVMPATREAPQAIVVLALEGATISLYYGLAEADALYLQEGEMFTFTNINRNGANIRINSTGAILMTYIGQAGIPLGVPGDIGVADHINIAPAANVIYGIPSSGYVTAFRDTAGSSRVDFQCSNSQNISRTMGIAQYAGSPFNTANYAGVACRAVGAASYKIGATSIGDSDGGKCCLSGALRVNRYARQCCIVTVMFVFCTLVVAGVTSM
eukprot:m.453164 g.453164  ORF g.453164 m.453164 type:complete len:268 (+) comp21547_c0_seq17:1109-1912(+)